MPLIEIKEYTSKGEPIEVIAVNPHYIVSARFDRLVTAQATENIYRLDYEDTDIFTNKAGYDALMQQKR